MTEKESISRCGGKNPPCAKHSDFPRIRISTPSTPLQLSVENNREKRFIKYMNKWMGRYEADIQGQRHSTEPSRVRIEGGFTIQFTSLEYQDRHFSADSLLTCLYNHRYSIFFSFILISNFKTWVWSWHTVVVYINKQKGLPWMTNEGWI